MNNFSFAEMLCGYKPGGTGMFRPGFRRAAGRLSCGIASPCARLDYVSLESGSNRGECLFASQY
jgi:hypothetical protein